MSAEVQEESDAQKTAARGQRHGGRGGTSVGQTEGQPPEGLQPGLPQAWLLQPPDPHEDGEELWRQPGLSRQSEASRLALLSQVRWPASDSGNISDKNFVLQVFRNFSRSYWIISTMATSPISNNLFMIRCVVKSTNKSK